MEVLEQAFEYLEGDGQIALFDGTNSTLERRKSMEAKVLHRFGESVKLVFLEIVCEDKTIIQNNVKKFKQRSPDYIASSMDEEDIVKDFMKRIALY